MRSLWTQAATLASLLALSSGARGESYTLIIAGLGGEPQYEQRFTEQAESIAQSARALAQTDQQVLKLVGADATLTRIRDALTLLTKSVQATDVVTLVLIGHGSFDGEEYRFNIPGPDITGSELRKLLSALPAREQLIVNTTSASGATVEQWVQPGRVVITATKSGGERTATRFAQYWAEALKGATADANRDEIVTASEAFDYASRQVAAAFKADVSMATEHARIEGGALAANLAVARRGSAVLSNDPEVRALLARRVDLEQQLQGVKDQRNTLPQAQYYDELERVLVQFARLQQQIDARQGAAVLSP
jgi:hypothetical protein